MWRGYYHRYISFLEANNTLDEEKLSESKNSWLHLNEFDKNFRWADLLLSYMGGGGGLGGFHPITLEVDNG